jgi:hypothetical protein
MKSQLNPKVKGRKYNGTPYLKLKMVKPYPRKKLRQRLRASISLLIAELHPDEGHTRVL